MPVRVQCVLFVKPSEVTASSESYAILPPEFVDHPACAIFTKNNIQLNPNSQVKINKNVRFRVIETFLDELKSNVVDPLQNVCLYVSGCNSAFVGSLFNKSNFKLKTRFRSTKIRSAMDERNLLVIEQFLKAEAIFEYDNDLFKGGTLLHFAADKGYKALLELLFKYGADLNTKTKGREDDYVGYKKRGSTPLHVAASSANLNIAELLLKKGGDINCKNDGLSTPLHLAVRHASLEMVQFLVERGADIEARQEDGYTPLHIAAEICSLQNKLEYLLQRGANPNCTIDYIFCLLRGATPLHLAVKGNRLKTVRSLVENGANINARCHYGQSILYHAINSGHIEVIEFILKCHPEVNDMQNQRAFRLAFCKKTQHSKIAVEKMLENGFSIGREHSNQPDFLFGAIHKKMLETVVKLLDYGASINQFHSFMGSKLSPLQLAVQLADADTRMAKLLLDRGANVNGRGSDAANTPLLDAIENKDTTLIKLLLSYSANVNLDYPNPLISAIKGSSDLQLIRLLLENGADVNAESTFRDTPLSTALREGLFEVAELLIKFGACFSFEFIEGKAAGNAQHLETSLNYGFVCSKPIDENGIRKLFHLYDWWTEGNPLSSYRYPAFAECAKIFAHHILKIDAVHESVDMRPLIPSTLFKLFDLNDFQSRCKAEVLRMKSMEIGRTNVTFYDILTKADDIPRYSKNEDFTVKFESHNAEGIFPIYQSILQWHFRLGTQRQCLLKTAVKMLKSLFSQFSLLPDEIKENIAEFLNNQDILILENCLNMK